MNNGLYDQSYINYLKNIKIKAKVSKQLKALKGNELTDNKLFY